VPRTLTYDQARQYAFLNQLATPGLGTFLSGRRWQGVLQMLLATIGFVLALLWFIFTMRDFYRLMSTDVEPGDHGRLGLLGLGIFAAAWIWSSVTSLAMLRQARGIASSDPPPPL
jgi:hypothetical protein